MSVPVCFSEAFKLSEGVPLSRRPLGALGRHEGPRSGPDLGNTGNSSGPITSAGRRRRFVLRESLRKWADRTLVSSTRSEWVRRQYEAKEMGYEAVEMEYDATPRPRDDRYLACGRRARAGGGVGLVFDENTHTAGFSGLMSCGSVWSCAVCASKIQAARARELKSLLSWARGQKHTIAMVTMTVRHDRMMPLVTPEEDTFDPETGAEVVGVWDAVSAGWEEATSGKVWGSESVKDYAQRLEWWHVRRELALMGEWDNIDADGLPVTHKRRMPRGGHAAVLAPPVRRIGEQESNGVIGWFRAVEVTNGVNGWHVHVHAVMILKGSPDAATVAAFRVGRGLWSRWEKGIQSVGFTASRDEGGLDIRVSRAAELRLAEYLTKDGLSDDPDGVEHVTNSFNASAVETAKEAVLGGSKVARKGGRTPFQILESIDPAAFDLPKSSPAYKRASRDLGKWREWVRGSEGRRQLTWSKGLRELAGLRDAELTDQELVDAAPEGEAYFWLPVETWKAVRDESWVLLELMEEGGANAVAAHLRSLRLPFDFLLGDAGDDPPDVGFSGRIFL